MEKKKAVNPEAKRPNGDLPLGRGEQNRLAKILSMAKKNSGGRLTVEQLAAQSSLSSRHLARLFSKEMQTRPSQYLEALRVQAAIRRLEHTDDSVAKIAKECGFGSRASLYRSFSRLVQTSPAEYRSRRARQSQQRPDASIDPASGSQEDDQSEFASVSASDRNNLAV